MIRSDELDKANARSRFGDVWPCQAIVHHVCRADESFRRQGLRGRMLQGWCQLPGWNTKHLLAHVCSGSDTNTNSLLVCAEATWYHLSPLNLFDYRGSAILSKDWDLPSDLTMIAGPDRESYLTEQAWVKSTIEWQRLQNCAPRKHKRLILKVSKRFPLYTQSF